MATASLLRCWSKGGQVLFRSPALSGRLSGLLKPDVTTRTFTLTPVASSVPEYFRARRGPFTPEEKQGKHMFFTSTHWKVERIVACSMLGIMPAALFIQTPAMEFLFTTTVFMHAFWSLDHVLSDYLQKFFPPIHFLWYAISIIAFAGLMNFNYNDVGIFKAIEMFWKL